MWVDEQHEEREEKKKKRKKMEKKNDGSRGVTMKREREREQ